MIKINKYKPKYKVNYLLAEQYSPHIFKVIKVDLDNTSYSVEGITKQVKWVDIPMSVIEDMTWQIDELYYELFDAPRKVGS